MQAKIEGEVAVIGVNIGSVKDLLKTHRKSLMEWRYGKTGGGPLVVMPEAIAATLKAIIDVHTEEYGAEKEGGRHTSSDRVNIPSSVRDEASEYIKNVAMKLNS